MTFNVQRSTPNIQRPNGAHAARLLAAAYLLACALPACAQTNAPDPWFADLLACFDGIGVRTVGSAGNREIESRVAARFAASGFEHGEMPFDAPAFMPGETWLRPAGGAPVRLLPMHPTLMRPGNFAAQSFDATLVDLGHGTEDDLAAVKGVPLRDAVVLMDFACGGNWQRLLRFGVQGVIFIGGDENPSGEAQAKLFTTEANVPRFFVDARTGAALRQAGSGRALSVHIDAQPSRWENRTVRDLWVLVPGSHAGLGREIVIVSAALDANGIVPELATGAQAAANLHLLLQLLEAYRQKPPARSVLLVAVNAHTQRYAGERVLAWNLLMPSAAIESTRDVVASEARYQELLACAYETLASDLGQPGRAQGAIDALLAAKDRSLGQNVALKLPLVTQFRRQVVASQAELAACECVGPDPAAQAHRAEVQTRAGEWEHLLGMFREVGARTPFAGLTPTERERLFAAAREIAADNRRLLELNRREIRMSEACRDVLRATAFGRVVMAINLELDWGRPEIGFATGNYWGDQSWPRTFGRNAVRIAEELQARAAGSTNLLLDTLTNVGGRPQGFFFPATSSSGDPFLATKLPAFLLETPFAGGGRAFSPDDTFTHLDARTLGVVGRFTVRYLAALLTDPYVTTPQELLVPSVAPPLWSCRVRTFRYDDFSPDVLPTLPVPGVLLVLHEWGSPFAGPDVTGAWMALTDARAAVTVIGLCKNTTWTPIFTQAYRLDAAGAAIDAVIDSGEAHNRLTSNLTSARELILALFPCREYPIRETADPSLTGAGAIGNQRYLVLDARFNAAPRRYGTVGFTSVFSSKRWPSVEINGPVALCVETNTCFKLVTDPGRRLAINGSPACPDGAGFGPGAPLPAAFFDTAAHDMGVLNASRLAGLKGVSDELAANFVAEGRSHLAAADARQAEHDHLGYLREEHAALGAEVKAYRQITTTRNDLLKAVVLYMALLLPFCLFLQKLLFKTVRVEAQMGIFVALFVVMYALFRNIHPAFAVARAPEAMFVAFVMGVLGIFVIWVLHGRFEGEMQVLFRAFEGGGGEGIGTSQAGQQALMIGVNNMKRRRIRTTLTTATIVLVTFTMLAFTSVSKQMNPTMVAKSPVAPYTGIFYHWPGRAMDEATLQTVLEDVHGRGQVVVRRWLLANSWENSGQRYVVPLRVRTPAGGLTANVEAALGLAMAEDGFLDRMALLPGGRFFSTDDAREMVLPESLATALGIAPDKLDRAVVEFSGVQFRVVGIMRDERLRAMRDLDQMPILPVKSVRRQAAEGPGEVVVEDDNETGVTRYEPSVVALLPVETCRRFGGKPFSISLRLRDDESVWPLAREMLTSTEAKFYLGSRVPFDTAETASDRQHEARMVESGVYYIGAGYRTAIGGLTRLIIPLLIAATIIFNTMLGSVFERKREIAIYNAVGLNPTHIGLFFLAEAFVYSVIGAVGGYLIGQLLGMGLKTFGLVSGVNLNFSSLSVVYVILFTIAIVLLSTLYPAMVATRAAVPSGKRKWSLPAHDGTRMHIVFPTIYRLELLGGVMAYLEQHFSRFAGLALADAMATRVAKETTADAQGRAVHTLVYDMALAPYDLGVTQRLTLRGAWDDQLGFARVAMTIERTSGQDSNWTAVNRPFLEKLRQHLMNWRNLDEAARQKYCDSASRE